VTDPAVARRWIDDRRQAVRERLADTESRLAEVRVARGDWTDEEHDPEGFALTFEWQHAEGARSQHLAELADLDRAEARVATGEFGSCTRCGEPIPAAQLELRPARTLCVRCADAQR
jgi:DnaK suppressor protein